MKLFLMKVKSKILRKPSLLEVILIVFVLIVMIFRAKNHLSQVTPHGVDTRYDYVVPSIEKIESIGY